MKEDKEKTSNAPMPNIGKALRVRSAKDADKQTSKEIGGTEENNDNKNNSLVDGLLPLRDKIIILVACIICCLAILYAYINNGNKANVKSVPKVEKTDTSAETDMADTVFVEVDNSASAEEEQTTPVDNREVLIKNLNGSSGSLSLNELLNNYACIGSWSIASGFGSGEVKLYKKGSKYILMDYSQNMCYQMKPHKVKSNNEFTCYALNGVDNYFHVDKGLTIYINPNLETAYDNNGNPYTSKLILISGYGYTGLCINDNSTNAGRNVYVEFLRLN